MYAGPAQARETESAGQRGNGGRSSSPPAPPGQTATFAASAANGRSPVDFVSEDDVRRAIQKGEKIYINSKTIITPAARDIGEPGEVFAKVESQCQLLVVSGYWSWGSFQGNRESRIAQAERKSFPVEPTYVSLRWAMRIRWAVARL